MRHTSLSSLCSTYSARCAAAPSLLVLSILRCAHRRWTCSSPWMVPSGLARAIIWTAVHVSVTSYVTLISVVHMEWYGVRPHTLLIPPPYFALPLQWSTRQRYMRRALPLGACVCGGVHAYLGMCTCMCMPSSQTFCYAGGRHCACPSGRRSRCS